MTRCILNPTQPGPVIVESLFQAFNLIADSGLSLKTADGPDLAVGSRYTPDIAAAPEQSFNVGDDQRAATAAKQPCNAACLCRSTG